MTQPHPYGQPAHQPQPADQPQQYGYPQQAGNSQQGGDPGATPSAAPPRKPLWKRWWFWVLAIVALFIVVGVAGGSDDSTADDTAADSAEAATFADDTGDESAEGAGEAGAEDGEAAAEDADASGAEYGIGDAVATGDWEITVSDVQDGVSEVGNEFLGTTAQGQFVLVEISVKNTGSSPSFFFDSDVKLKDDDGNTYSSDSEAAIYAASDNDVVLLEEINPGNTASGLIVFDVPADASPNVLEFQGGIFDTPAAVALD